MERTPSFEKFRLAAFDTFTILGLSATVESMINSGRTIDPLIIGFISANYLVGSILFRVLAHDTARDRILNLLNNSPK